MELKIVYFRVEKRIIIIILLILKGIVFNLALFNINLCARDNSNVRGGSLILLMRSRGRD